VSAAGTGSLVIVAPWWELTRRCLSDRSRANFNIVLPLTVIGSRSATAPGAVELTVGNRSPPSCVVDVGAVHSTSTSPLGDRIAPPAGMRDDGRSAVDRSRSVIAVGRCSRCCYDITSMS
jgi:hypothetical protein